MGHVTTLYQNSPKRLLVIADATPPRSGDPSFVDNLKDLNTDFISMAYNPGKLVRMSSPVAAYIAKQNTLSDSIFTIATRDMNKIAIGTELLGAQALGLENVIVVQGDRLGEREISRRVSPVDNYTSTALISSIADMNRGSDYREGKLRTPTNFCIGATIDLSRGIDTEAVLAQRKVQAGAQFFITQPIYDVAQRERFLERYHLRTGEDMVQPVFWGIQILEKDGVLLSDTPIRILEELENGKSGAEIAVDTLSGFVKAGIRGVYLVPPILKGGARDYKTTRQVLDAV